MKIRTRTDITSAPWETKTFFKEKMVTDRLASGGNYCQHTKVLSTHTGNVWSSGSYSVGPFPVTNRVHVHADNVMNFINSLSLPLASLNREKLPSTSDFNILLFVYELEDTLKTFTLNFWKSLSYGSASWGVGPLINDMIAIESVITKLASSQASQPYEDQYSRTIEKQTDLYSRYSVDYVCRFTGSIAWDDIPVILKLYDSVGFHPDLSTVWDAIPLSFLIDYFVNIGDIVDRIHTRGWVSSVSFYGWRTLKLLSSHYERKERDRPLELISQTRFFQRDFVEDFYLTIPLADPTALFTVPSTKQLFDSAYIAQTIMRSSIK